MKTWFPTNRKLTRAAFVLTLTLSPAFTQAGVAYLPKTGPVPLRLEAVQAQAKPFVLPPLAMDNGAPTNLDSGALGSPLTPTPTNAVPLAPVVPPTNSVSAVSPTTPDEQVPTDAELVSSSSASDLLVVSPQMLAEYFKPMQTGTNLTTVPVIVPTEVGFVPPIPKAAAPSRATYKIQ
jgi:hypothetical protein